MKRYLFVVLMLLTSVYSISVAANISISENSVIEFASKKQAGKLLSKDDEYIARLSKFDLIAKMQGTKVASKKQFLAFSRKQGLKWNAQERKKLTVIVQQLTSLLAPYTAYFPEKIQLVKTTGRLESGAFYTRGTSIFIPEQNVTRSSEILSTVILHELFHVITRNNPELRDRLYAAIGFVKTTELVLPESLQDKKISNPDVPVLTHLIKVRIDGEPYWVTPLVYASRDYDRTIKRVFFQYLQLGMLAYRWDGESDPQAVMIDGKPLLVPFDRVEGLYEQIGRNTQYLFHAEEVLADNFALLVQGHSVANPEVLERMKAAFNGEEVE